MSGDLGADRSPVPIYADRTSTDLFGVPDFGWLGIMPHDEEHDSHRRNTRSEIVNRERSVGCGDRRDPHRMRRSARGRKCEPYPEWKPLFGRPNSEHRADSRHGLSVDYAELPG
jgi:hypothetical protein